MRLTDWIFVTACCQVHRHMCEAIHTFVSRAAATVDDAAHSATHQPLAFERRVRCALQVAADASLDAGRGEVEVSAAALHDGACHEPPRGTLDVNGGHLDDESLVAASPKL